MCGVVNTCPAATFRPVRSGPPGAAESLRGNAIVVVAMEAGSTDCAAAVDGKPGGVAPPL
jgi:hypothetical protein